jgi:hypothetical protein
MYLLYIWINIYIYLYFVTINTYIYIYEKYLVRHNTKYYMLGTHTSTKNWCDKLLFLFLCVCLNACAYAYVRHPLFIFKIYKYKLILVKKDRKNNIYYLLNYHNCPPQQICTETNLNKMTIENFTMPFFFDKKISPYLNHY